jgi:hypothetical protein
VVEAAAACVDLLAGSAFDFFFFSVQTSSSSLAAADHVPQLLDIATHLTLLHNHFSILVATIPYQTLTGPAAPCSSSSAAEADHLPHRRMAVRPSSSSAAPEHLPHQRQRRCAHREDSEASAAFSQTTAPPAAPTSSRALFYPDLLPLYGSTSSAAGGYSIGLFHQLPLGPARGSFLLVFDLTVHLGAR